MSSNSFTERRLTLSEQLTKKAHNVLVDTIKYATDPAIAPAARDKAFTNIAYTLSVIELELKKTREMTRVNQLDEQACHSFKDDIHERIRLTEEQIGSAMEELKEEQQLRANKLEYDLLAKDVQKYPPRSEMQRKIDQVDKELSEIAKTKNELDKQLDRRKRQFALLMHAARDMQLLLTEPESSSEITEDDQQHDTSTTRSLVGESQQRTKMDEARDAA